MKEEYKIIRWLDGRYWQVPRIIRLTRQRKKYVFFGPIITETQEYYTGDNSGYDWYYADKPEQPPTSVKERLRNIWNYEGFLKEQEFVKSQQEAWASAEIKFVTKNSKDESNG